MMDADTQASGRGAHPGSGAFILAMTGGSGSGKSTLAEALRQRLPPGSAVLLSEDRYYWPLARYGTARTEQERQALIQSIDFDDPAAKDSARLAADLKALRAGRAARVPIYDYKAHDRCGEAELRPAALVILEGIHALSLPELSGLIDLSVYVDTPDDLRLARRLRRDVVERGRDVEDVLSQYLGTVRPAHYSHTYPARFRADLVLADDGLPAVGGVAASEAAVERMLAPIQARLQARGVALRPAALS